MDQNKLNQSQGEKMNIAIKEQTNKERINEYTF